MLAVRISVLVVQIFVQILEMGTVIVAMKVHVILLTVRRQRALILLSARIIMIDVIVALARQMVRLFVP